MKVIARNNNMQRKDRLYRQETAWDTTRITIYFKSNTGMYWQWTIVEYTWSKSGLEHFKEYEVESYNDTTSLLTIEWKQHRLYERVEGEWRPDRLKKVFKKVTISEDIKRLREEYEKKLKDKAKERMKYI